MTINKYALCKRISEKLKCTNVLALQFMNVLSDIILEEIADGNSIILGAVGKLIVHEIKPRKGINPATKQSIMIPGKLRLKISSYRAAKGVLHRRFKNLK